MGVGVAMGWDTTTNLFLATREAFMLTFKRFNENRWQPRTKLPLKIIYSVSSSWNSAGIAVFGHRGSRLKASKV